MKCFFFLLGLYCSGWLKTGPTGVIATTMNNSFDTGRAVVEDMDSGTLDVSAAKPGAQSIGALLDKRGILLLVCSPHNLLLWPEWLMKEMHPCYGNWHLTYRVHLPIYFSCYWIKQKFIFSFLSVSMCDAVKLRKAGGVNTCRWWRNVLTSLVSQPHQTHELTWNIMT